MKNLLFLATTLPLVSAFTAPVPHSSRISRAGSYHSPLGLGPNAAPISRGFSVLRRMSSDGGGDEVSTTSPPRKRRTRKDGKQFAPPSAEEKAIENDSGTVEPEAQAETQETEPAPAPETPKQNVVVMQVRDIRDVVSGAPESPAVEEVEAVAEEEEDDDETLADDEEWEYYDVDKDGNEIVATDAPVGGRSQDESMEQLLADARSMRASSISEEEEETPLKDKVFEVISTIVTVDFFVVCALLVWFLAGIFCSYVLKDDAVQIAFNMNFERVTQPALGILMIGSVAGSFGNKDEEDEDFF